MKAVAAVVVTLVVATGCSVEKGPGGGDGHAGLVVGTAETAYDGPLVVRDARFGAAGEVVECRHEVSGGRAEEQANLNETFDSPAEALANEIGMVLGSWPRGGYRIAAERPKRVLLTWAHGDRDVLAVITTFGRGNLDKTGWYVESWARCDPADFPDATALEMGYEVWSERNGRVSTKRISSSAGPAHCDWQESTILHVGRATYWRNAPADLGEYFTVPYAEGMELPADAQPTPYSRQGRRLWLSPDQTVAYVGTSRGGVERWVRPTRPLLCA
jgi:hypothetical protein